MSFAEIPELLEEVAYQVVLAQDPLLPPSAILPLLLTCRNWNRWLSHITNPHLYTRIFRHKFDTGPLLMRGDTSRLTPQAFTSELRLRCNVLKQLRSGAGSHHSTFGSLPTLQVLWTAYLMMLENESRNVKHLRNYASTGIWLRAFLLDSDGGSFLSHDLAQGIWPEPTFESRLAMWLFWFIYNQERLDSGAIRVLKTIALSSYKYELCHTTWHSPSVNNTFRHASLSLVCHYSDSLKLVVPPVSTPAILLFISSLDISKGYGMLSRTPINPCPNEAEATIGLPCNWIPEWEQIQITLKPSWLNGCIDGTWEGPFLYTDFEIFASLETTQAPLLLRECDVAHHDQLWSLREYHQSPDHQAIPFGGILDAFFPDNYIMQERDQTLILTDSSSNRVVHYSRWYHASTDDPDLDIIVVGEGHSNWGRFSLRGRVRKSDGFVTFLKRYGDGARGDWLYRGYVVGHPRGNFVGRWRETVTPIDEVAYEGCFSLARRQ